LKLPVALVLLVTLVVPAAAQSQGIPGGAKQGYDDGNCVAGPLGGIIGAAVGGVVGGLVGGVNGMLGIEQRKDADRRDRGKTEKRCNNQQRR
jgi:hypothetical protein